MAKGRLRRRLARIDANLTTRPDADLVDILNIPEPFVSPTQRIIRRIVYAMSALFLAVLIVYLDRHGYRDVEAARTRRPAVVPGLPVLRDRVAVDDWLR